MTYTQKLRDPRWQRLASNVRTLAEWKCDECGRADLNLQVHHKVYERGREPWDYPLENFQCLCEVCHQEVEDALQNMRQAFASVPFYDLNSLAFNFMKACESVNPTTLMLALNVTLDQVVEDGRKS